MMDVPTAAVVREALSWEGTPFSEGQSVKGLNGGVDCVMFIKAVGEAAGGLSIPQWVVDKYWPYSQLAEKRKLITVLDKCLIRVPGHFAADIPGSVVCFLLKGPHGRKERPQHLAIVTKPGWLIHPLLGGKVVHATPRVPPRYCGAWRFPALA